MLPPPRRPGTKAGLNRFVWDMKYPGPTRLDYGLAPPQAQAAGARSREPARPDGRARHLRRRSSVVGGKSQSARFTVVKDPRLPTTPAEYAAQFALHKELIASVSKLKQAVNRLRRMKRQLDEATGHLGKGERALKNRAAAIGRKLSAIESVMVDPHRKSVRDVLRNPAGLNDTLIDMVAMATTADRPPTTQTKEVSREVMAKVDSEVAKFEALVKDDIAQLNAALAKARVKHVTAA